MGERYAVGKALGPADRRGQWFAKDTATGTNVVLAALESADAPWLSDARRIDSPHVARLLDITEYEGAPYAVMELVEGTTLRSLLDRKTFLPWREAKGLAEGMLAGLVAVHERRLCHGRVSPDCLLVTSEGVARLVGPLLSPSPAPVATIPGLDPVYRPPERTMSDACDVYAAGVVIAEMLTGQAPRPKRRFALERDWQAPIAIRPVRELVRQLMSPSPHERPAADVARKALSRVPTDTGLPQWAEDAGYEFKQWSAADKPDSRQARAYAEYFKAVVMGIPIVVAIVASAVASRCQWPF